MALRKRSCLNSCAIGLRSTLLVHLENLAAAKLAKPERPESSVEAPEWGRSPSLFTCAFIVLQIIQCCELYIQVTKEIHSL